MKRSIKAKGKRGSARDLFAELSEGMEAIADARHGKRTLRTHALEFKAAERHTRGTDSIAQGLETLTWGFCGLPTHKRSHVGELGTGSRKTKRASGPPDQSL